MPMHINCSFKTGVRRDILVVVVAGILTVNTEEAAAPIRSEFDRFDALYISYQEPYVAVGAAREIAETIAERKNSYSAIIFEGVSKGGMLVPWIIHFLRKMPGFPINILGSHIQDSPSGCHHFYGLNNQWSARLGFLLPSADWVRQQFINRIVPPNSDNFEPWNPTLDYDYLGRHPADVEERNKLIVEYCLKQRHDAFATRHLFKRYIRQISWMVWGSRRIPWHELRDIPTIYTACTGTANRTVLQPQAAHAWREATGCQIQNMPYGAHVAFAERPGEWRSVIRSALEELVTQVTQGAK